MTHPLSQEGETQRQEIHATQLASVMRSKQMALLCFSSLTMSLDRSGKKQLLNRP